MILFHQAKPLADFLTFQKKQGKKIGFVPTMGALHKGHISLIEEAKKERSIIVCSIFINPTQFNDPADFKKYPISIESDIQQLEAAGTDILFLPRIAEIYPDGTVGVEHYDIGYLETVLEGKFRPGHFQGVNQVVNRLVKIVQPDKIFMGQKDFQQCMVIKKMLFESYPSTQLVICPIIREAGGLAMSSRNKRLNEEQKENATVIYQALQFIKKHLRQGNLRELKNSAASMLVGRGLRIDYIEIVDAENFQILNFWNGRQKLIALIAAFMDDVRLIDNLLL